MDLLKYLEPMKNIPDRFSNLAFWRGVRKLRDEVVNAFEYVDSWGENVEHELANVTKVNYTVTSISNIKEGAVNIDFHVIEDIEHDTVIIMFAPFDISADSLPSDYGSVVGIEFSVNMDTNAGGSVNTVMIPCEIIRRQTGPSTFGYLFHVSNTCCVAIDKYTERAWTKPYNLQFIRAFLVYHPTL